MDTTEHGTADPGDATVGGDGVVASGEPGGDGAGHRSSRGKGRRGKPGSDPITNPARANRDALAARVRYLEEENEQLREHLAPGARIPAGSLPDLLDETASAHVARWIEAVEALSAATMARFVQHADVELHVAQSAGADVISLADAHARCLRTGIRPDLARYVALWEHVCALYPHDGASVDVDTGQIRPPHRRLQTVEGHVVAYRLCTRIPRASEDDRAALIERLGSSLTS
jgi:hypothetical protein